MDTKGLPARISAARPADQRRMHGRPGTTLASIILGASLATATSSAAASTAAFALPSSFVPSVQHFNLHSQTRGSSMATHRTQSLPTTSRPSFVKMSIAPLPAGKRMGEPSLTTVVGTAVLGVPIWLLLLVPSAAISQAILAVVRTFSPRTSAVEQRDDQIKFPAPGEVRPLAARKLDLVLLGATGFTGQLAAEHLARQYGNDGRVKWAIAGRRRNALEAIRKKAAELSGDSSVLDVPIIVVDTHDRTKLHALVEDTRVVASTAGPFALHGSNAVEFCARFGTSWCDITGEADWVREMIARWDDTARATGAKIVSFCGHDSVPWDLSVAELARAMRKRGEELSSVECFDEVKGGVSGGTLATMMLAISGGIATEKRSFDPLLRLADGSKSQAKTKITSPLLPSFSATAGQWTGPFLMAGVNAQVVRRSHALLNPGGGELAYVEVALHSSFGKAFVEFVGLGMFATALFCPPLRMLLANFVLPKPGEGPSLKQMQHGFLRITAVGTGNKGSRLQSEIFFDKDAGYRETARMLVESALSIALENDRLPTNGGVFTPAACQGNVLLERLQKTGGTTFSISSLE